MEQELLELIEGIKNGRQEDFEHLKVRYAPLINDMADSFFRSGAGLREDLYEEALGALLRAALTFDTAKEKITFGLYAKICIRNCLISVRRAKAAREAKASRGADKGAGEGTGKGTGRGAGRGTGKGTGKGTGRGEKKRERAVGSLDFGDLDPADVLEALENELSSYEKLVLKEYFSGRSAKETAAVLGRDEKSVNNAVCRIRQKDKKLLEKLNNKV